jgi:hypothetical protein
MIDSDFNLTPIMVEADFNQISDCLPRHAEEILSAGQLHISLQWMRMNPLAGPSLCPEGLNDGDPPQTGGKPCLLQKVKPLRVAPPQDDLHNEGSHLPVPRTPPLDFAALLAMTTSLLQSVSPNSRTPTTEPYRQRVNIRIIGNHQAHKKQIVALSHCPSESLSRPRRSLQRSTSPKGSFGRDFGQTAPSH